MIHLSIFRSATDSTPTLDSVPDFAGLLDYLLPSRPVARKEAAPLFSPAEYAPGTTRAASNVTRIHFGVLDLDHLSEEQNAYLHEILHAESRAFALIPSHSNAPPRDYRYRLLVPFSRPVHPAEWKALWPRLRATFGNLADPQCSDASRMFYAPTHPEHAIPQAPLIRAEGSPLDVDALLQSHLRTDVLVQSRAVQTVPKQALDRLVTRLNKANDPAGVTLSCVLQGISFAPAGSRDNALFALCRALVAAFPDADPTILASYFETSCNRMASDPGAPTPALVREKLIRLQSDRYLEEQIAIDKEAREAKAAIESAPATAEDFGTVTEKRILVQSKLGYYVYAGHQLGYKGPYVAQELPVAAERILAPLRNQGIAVRRGDGEYKPAPSLMAEYGTHVDRIVADYLATKTHVDFEKSIIHEAPCPPRKLEPAFNAAIDQWLRLLGGDQYPALEKWLAYVTHLDHPCVALFLSGPPGTGKTMLAQGVARIWSQNGPTTMEQVLSGFNESMLECPVVLADEQLPTDFRGRPKTAELREMIQGRTRAVRRKHRGELSLSGCVRAVITSNNLNPFGSAKADLGPDDIKAVGDRLLHILATQKVADYLDATDTTGWVDGDIIARHALWLATQIPLPAHKPRFLIESSNIASVASMMAISGTYSGAICHWIVQWLLDERKGMNQGLKSAALVSKGRLFVNQNKLLSAWGAYSTGLNTLTAAHLGQALQTIGLKGSRVMRNRVWYRQVKLEALADWVSLTGTVEVEELVEGIVANEEKETHETLS